MRDFADTAKARAQGLQTKNDRSFYLLNTRSICVFSLFNLTQRIDGFSLLLQRYARVLEKKVNKNTGIKN